MIIFSNTSSHSPLYFPVLAFFRKNPEDLSLPLSFGPCRNLEKGSGNRKKGFWKNSACPEMNRREKMYKTLKSTNAIVGSMASTKALLFWMTIIMIRLQDTCYVFILFSCFKIC